MPPKVPPPPPPRLLDPKIWRACAGGFVKIPTVNSRVYYFPQGHIAEAFSLPHDISSLLVLPKPYIICSVSSVQLLADKITDEVFAKLTLHPIVDFTPVASVPNTAASAADDDRIASYAKILTHTDVEGIQFAVPKVCACSIFPSWYKSNAQANSQLQKLSVTDVHGTTWKFHHVIHRKPERHKITSGWFTFVRDKKLVPSDSVVFMKNSKGELFVGIRRGVPRSVRSTVVEAVKLAVNNMPFEVVYYPKTTEWFDFVVKAEAVEKALSVKWSPGLRIKMDIETDTGDSRIREFYGIVSSVYDSPWRKLQITWEEDDPQVLKNFEWVSPWQLQVVPPASVVVFPPAKKIRAADGSGMSIDGGRGGGDPFSVTEFANSTMGHLTQTLLSCDGGTFPAAGMQGARHDDLFSAAAIQTEQQPAGCIGDDSSKKGCNETEAIDNDNRVNKFLLFGAVIQTEHPVESGSNGTGCIGDDSNSSKGCNETEGIDNPLDDSLTYSEMLVRLDG